MAVVGVGVGVARNKGMDTDLQDLMELQAELAALERSVYQPSCVSRVFATAAEEAPFVFRMQTWIDLDAIRSPVLELRLPHEDEGVLPALAGALAAFGHHEATVEELEPEQVIMLFGDMIAAVQQGFSMRLTVEPPRRAESRADGGFGSWLPLYTCLLGQLYIPRAEVRQMPVAEAFAILAAHRWCHGWSVQGETYKNRDVREDRTDG